MCAFSENDLCACVLADWQVDGLGDKGVDLIGESAGGGSAGAGAALGPDGFEHHDSLLPAELVGGMDASGAPKLVHFM